MKNKEKNNFTKLTHKKGISLIVMIITIVVIIILSAVIVMTISRNNPLSSAREAVFKEDISNFKTELELYKANMKYRDENPEELNANRETTPHIQEVITSMPNKYAKILEVRDGKLVYVGNNKAEYLLAYEIGMLPEDELLNDEFMEELQPFITEWTVNDNDSITLPVNDLTCSFTVDYGDGTGEYKVRGNKDEDLTHTYEKAGTYTVTIKGKCTSFAMSGCESREKLTKLVQWGSTGFKGVNFAYCSNLTGEIPEPSVNSLKSLTNLTYLFDNCIGLVGEIPEKLFSNCTKVTRVDGTFRNCTGLTGEIPENLFADCVNLEFFGNGFKGCSGLTGSIPENFFANCPEITSFGWAFSGCTGLIGEIPENLFASCKKVSNFEYVFRGCTGLSRGIPEKIFANNEKVTNARGAFYDCTGLTGEIPEKIFANFSEVKNLQNMFRGCSGLTNSIPENLFANCPYVTDMSGVFFGCTGLTGSIPENLFEKCPEITTFNITFAGCTGLTGSIPENLFANCTKVSIFYGTFKECKFFGNAPALWERENVTNNANCFSGCTNLSNYNEIPSSWGGGGS